MECRSPFLILYGTEHTLRKKRGFSSSFLSRLKQIQISENLHPCHLQLLFLREELQPVWQDQLHITVLQAHVHTHTLVRSESALDHLEHYADKN